MVKCPEAARCLETAKAIDRRSGPGANRPACKPRVRRGVPAPRLCQSIGSIREQSNYAGTPLQEPPVGADRRRNVRCREAGPNPRHADNGVRCMACHASSSLLLAISYRLRQSASPGPSQRRVRVGEMTKAGSDPGLAICEKHPRFIAMATRSPSLGRPRFSSPSP